MSHTQWLKIQLGGEGGGNGRMQYHWLPCLIEVLGT